MPDEPEKFQMPWETMMPKDLDKERFPLTTTLGDLISKILPYVFSGAGIALFLYLLWGGLQFLTSGGEPKAVEGAKKKITNALIGFAIIFAAFFIIKAIEEILGIPAPVE